MAPNFIKAFMVPKSENLAFSNLTIQVNSKGASMDMMKLILKNFHWILNIRMENNGKIIKVSGCFYPSFFVKCLKKAGKKIRMLRWQYGECSSNLFEKPLVAKLPKENKSDGEDCSGHDIEKPTNSEHDAEKPRNQVAIVSHAA